MPPLYKSYSTYNLRGRAGKFKTSRSSNSRDIMSASTYETLGVPYTVVESELLSILRAPFATNYVTIRTCPIELVSVPGGCIGILLPGLMKA